MRTSPGPTEIIPNTSIAIGADGLPVISHREATNRDLKVAACDTPACTSATLSTVVDDDAIVGWFTSIAVGAHGVPIISYGDATNGNLKVAACGHHTC